MISFTIDNYGQVYCTLAERLEREGSVIRRSNNIIAKFKDGMLKFEWWGLDFRPTGGEKTIVINIVIIDRRHCFHARM